MINIFPSNPEFKKKYPEIYPIVDGKSWFPPDQPAKGVTLVGSKLWQSWHPCYTKAATVEIATEKALQAFKSGQYCFSLGINDGERQQCQCPECQKLGFPNSYYQFVTKVADAVRESYPSRFIGVIAYGDVRVPPADLILPDNVVVIVTAGAGGILEKWTKSTKNLGVYDHFYGVGFWVPFVPFKSIQSNFQFYKAHNVNFYRGEYHPVWAFDAPVKYFSSRLTWEPNLDPESALKRFCSASFGAGGDAMCRFYQIWSRLNDNDVETNGISRLTLRWPIRLWGDPINQFQRCAPADYTAAAKCLAEARSKTQNDLMAGKRLDMVEAFFEESRVFFEMYQLAKHVFDDQEKHNGEANIQEALLLKARHEKLITEIKNHPEWLQGTEAEQTSPIEYWRGVKTKIFPFTQEIENVMATEAFRLKVTWSNQPAAFQIPDSLAQLKSYQVNYVKLKGRPPQAKMFSEEMYLPLVCETGDGIKFHTAGTNPKITRENLQGQYKLHYGVTHLQLNDGTQPCLLEFSGTGQQGRLSLRIINAGISEGFIEEEFGVEPRTITKKIVMMPSAHPKFLMARMEWRPLGDSSKLEVRMKQGLVGCGMKFPKPKEPSPIHPVNKQNAKTKTPDQTEDQLNDATEPMPGETLPRQEAE